MLIPYENCENHISTQIGISILIINFLWFWKEREPVLLVIISNILKRAIWFFSPLICPIFGVVMSVIFKKILNHLRMG